MAVAPTDYAGTSGNTPMTSTSPAMRQGMEVRMGPQELEAVGTGKTPPTVGDKVQMHGEVVKHEAHPDGTHTVHVHVHKMSHDGEEKKSTASKIYGGKETAKEEKAEAKSEKY